MTFLLKTLIAGVIAASCVRAPESQSSRSRTPSEVVAAVPENLAVAITSESGLDPAGEGEPVGDGLAETDALLLSEGSDEEEFWDMPAGALTTANADEESDPLLETENLWLPESGDPAAVPEAAAAPAPSEVARAVATVLGSRVRVRKGPGTKHDTAGYLSRNATVTILERHDGWLRINDRGDWVHGSLVAENTEPKP